MCVSDMNRRDDFWELLNQDAHQRVQLLGGGIDAKTAVGKLSKNVCLVEIRYVCLLHRVS